MIPLLCGLTSAISLWHNSPMKKQKTAFVVTITTDGPVKQKHLADLIREWMYEAEAEGIVKVTVTPIGEK